jgi:hypothetical protein
MFGLHADIINEELSREYVISQDYDFNKFFYFLSFSTPEIYGYFEIDKNYTIELQRVDVYINDFEDNKFYDDTGIEFTFLINGNTSTSIYGRETYGNSYGGYFP